MKRIRKTGKSFVSLFFAACIALALVGCGNNEEEQPVQEQTTQEQTTQEQTADEQAPMERPAQEQPAGEHPH